MPRRRFNFGEGPKRRFSENGNGHHRKYRETRRLYRPSGNAPLRRIPPSLYREAAPALQRPRKAQPPQPQPQPKSLPGKMWGLLKRFAGGIARRITGAARALRRKITGKDDAYYRVFGV